MSKTNVVEVSGRDTIADPLTELLRSGAERLIHRAVEVELEDLLSAHSDRYSGWKSRCGAQWLPARTRATDGIGSGDGNDPQSTIEDGRGGDFSIGPGAPVREEDDESGSRGAVAVLEGDIQR